MAYLSSHLIRWRKMLVLTFPIPPKNKKSSVGTLDIWTYGSNSPMPKKTNIQPIEVDSKWILDEESLPHFPAFIYDMLPPFLKEVLGNCISEDDRDMMLMSRKP